MCLFIMQYYKVTPLNESIKHSKHGFVFNETGAGLATFSPDVKRLPMWSMIVGVGLEKKSNSL